MRNLVVDLIAGIMVTIQAFYDFNSSWSYVFFVFGLLIAVAEVWNIYCFKHGKKGIFNGSYRYPMMDYTDIGLVIALIVSFYDWLGTSSTIFWLLMIPSAIVAINSVYNILSYKDQQDDSKHNGLKKILNIITSI